MLKTIVQPLLLASAMLLAGAVQADEAAVKKALDEFIGSPAVDSVRKTEYAGMYEVVLRSGELFYTDEKVTFIVDGRLIDTRTRSDVTQARMNELSAIDFAALPLDQSIKQVRGSGKRIIASFEDPNCGYCKRFAQELAMLDDVTVYTFLYPVLGADSDAKSRDIWCAADRAKAWNDWMLENRTPLDTTCDSSVVDKNVALGRSLKIQGTPTFFLADGKRFGGYVRLPQLEEALAAVP